MRYNITFRTPIITSLMITSLMITSLMITSCGDSPGGDPSKPFTARIVTSVGGGKYELTEVEYTTLNSIKHMKGDYAKIIGGASLDLNADAEEVVTSNNPDDIYKDLGQEVNLDFYLDGNVVVPRTGESMEMLGLYYVFERSVTYWVTHFGINPKVFRLFYNPSLKASVDGLELELKLKLNAAFMPGPRDFFLFETSSLIEDLPVKMNFGIIAHEFGHAIFDETFAQKDASYYETTNDLASEQLSGMNEGVSDFFSFMVTGSVNEFGNSISFLEEERAMPVSWTYSSLGDQSCADSFYCKGSIIASALHEVATSGGLGALEVGKDVFAALATFRADWSAQKGSSSFDYHYLLNRILAEANDSEKVEYCESFEKWFDKSPVLENLACDE